MGCVHTQTKRYFSVPLKYTGLDISRKSSARTDTLNTTKTTLELLYEGHLRRGVLKQWLAFAQTVVERTSHKKCSLLRSSMTDVAGHVYDTYTEIKAP